MPTLTAFFSGSIGPIFKILFSADSGEGPLSKYAKISTRESIRNAKFTKFDTRKNKYIYSTCMSDYLLQVSCHFDVYSVAR